MRIIVPVFAILTLLGGCVAPPAIPVPPPLPAEIIPLPPVSNQELIWRPGDWIYVAGSYRYEPGRYVPRAGRNAAWVFGHWVGTRDQYAWVPGDWN